MKIAIYGYGQLGRGVEKAVRDNGDVTLTGIFSRHTSEAIATEDGNTVYPADDVFDFKNDIDVLVLCAGSARDLPKLTPLFAKDFNVVDSFDTHKKMKEHYGAVEDAAKKSGHTAIIGAGWDPGFFSVMRAVGDAFIPRGKTYTFWGRGVSRGHSEAICGLRGVSDAIQYTVPDEEILSRVRSGEIPDVSDHELHRRECYVVATGDKERIEREIKNMPYYFDHYRTHVEFIDGNEMRTRHAVSSHGGCVIRNGVTGKEIPQSIDVSLKLGSNPEFTGSVMIAYSRAAYMMNLRGTTGCKTVLEVLPADLLPESVEGYAFTYI